MAEARGGAGTRKRESPALQKDDWKHLARVGSLLVVVLGALLMGGLLQLDASELSNAVPATEAPVETTLPDRSVAPESPESPESLEPREIDTAPTPIPVAPAADSAPAPREPAAGTNLHGLAGRVGADVERLGGGAGWLLQIAANCDPENVERKLSETPSRRLHVLPVEIGERACFRICWGPFASRSAAEAAIAEIPAALRAAGDSPQPRLVADLIP